MTRAHLSEFPIERALKRAVPSASIERVKEEAKQLGRVDLWCKWNGRQFFLELKQADVNLLSGEPSKNFGSVTLDIENTIGRMAVEKENRHEIRA